MSKEALNVKTARGCLRSKHGQHGWALCIGAGTSLPIFPTWHVLVRRLMHHIEDAAGLDDMLSSLSDVFGYDALIQAAYDRSDLKHDQFTSLIANELYRDLRAKASEHEWKLIATVFTNNSLA